MNFVRACLQAIRAITPRRRPNIACKQAPTSRKLEQALTTFACAVVAWFFVWTVRSNGEPWKFGQEQRDYYNLLIDGWLEGQLHMKIDPPAALLALADPYDPRQRPPGLALHDASLYAGKYYLYFGAGPVVTLLLPFRLLTGTDLPQAVAVLLFTLGGFLASVAMWLAVRRRYFPDTGAAVSVLCGMTLGLASLGPVLLRRPHMWELPIAAAYCLAMVGLWCVWRAVHCSHERERVGSDDDKASTRSRSWLRRQVWFAAAGLAFGLAIASRPTYLIATALLLLPPLVLFWREDRRLPWREVVSAAVPLVVIGALMALHNYARFRDPLQFGQAYQLSSDYEAQVQHFSPRYMPFHAWRYFFSPAEWSRYYPFITPVTLPPDAPRAAHEHVYGVFTNMWIAWAALAAPLALWRRPADERRRLAASLASVGALFAGVAVLLLCFFGSVPRYMIEFTPALMLLACVGVAALERAAREWRTAVARGLLRAVWVTAAAGSIGFGVIFSLQVNRLLAERNPSAHEAVARALNRVPAVVERALGVRHGAVEIVARFRPQRIGEAETLLSIGDPPNVDRIFVRYLDPERVQLGFDRVAMPPLLSEPIQIDAGDAQRVRVVIGGLLPPPTHPWSAKLAPEENRRVSRLLRVELNGQPLVQAYRRFDHVGGGRMRIGRKSLGDTMHPRFSGEVVDVRRVEIAATALAALHVSDPLHAPGDVFSLRLSFPRDRVGVREPLIVTGSTGRGDLFGVEYLDAHRARFVFDHWGHPPVVSEPVDLARGVPHQLLVRLPWLAASTHRPEYEGQLQVVVDGNEVWKTNTIGYTAEPEEVAVGHNPIGGTHPGVKFTGEISSVQRDVRN